MPVNAVNKHQYYQDEGKPFDFGELLNKFLRRRVLFLYVAIPLFLYMFINNITKPYSPIYRASFDIGIIQERPVEGFFSQMREPTLQIGVATQRVISSLLSLSLAEKVVDSMDLYSFVKDGYSDLKIDLVMEEDLKETIGPLKIKIAGGRYTISYDGNQIAEGTFSQSWVSKDSGYVEQSTENEYVNLGPCELRITPLRKIPDGSTYELVIYPKKRMALAVRNSISMRVLDADKIEKEGGSSGIPYAGEGAAKEWVTATSVFPRMNLLGILRIGVHWGSREGALRIANILANTIIEQDRVEKSLAYTQSKAFIDSQLAFYQSRLGRLEDDMQGFKERKQITDLAASTQALIAQISDLESRKNQLQIEEKILRDLSDYLNTITPGSNEEIVFSPTMIGDPSLQSIYSQVVQTEAELRAKSKEYASGHPKIIELNATLDGLKEQLKEEIPRRLSSIKSEIASVGRQIGMLQAKLENVPDNEVKLARYGRDKETAEKLYTLFAEKLEETRVQEAGVLSDLRIINPPMLAPSPVNRRGRMKDIIMSFVLSLLAGVFAVFVAEYLDRTVKEPDTIKAKLNIPILASIPRIGNDTRGAKKKHHKILELLAVPELIKTFVGERASGTEPLQVLTNDISTPEFESFRKLIVNLDLLEHSDYRVLYVTSAGPGDGKTFVALNLGFVLGTMGKSVILVDTDFRKKRGHLTEIAQFIRREGIFDVLKGEKKLEDAIIRISDKKFDMLSTGKIPPNPFPYLESVAMKEIIEQLKEMYNYILIDGVPVLLFADAPYLANSSDGVLLAARYGKTGIKELENSWEILNNAKSKIIGLVLNDVPKTRGTYYYDYYYKHYSKYYRKGSKS